MVVARGRGQGAVLPEHNDFEPPNAACDSRKQTLVERSVNLTTAVAIGICVPMLIFTILSMLGQERYSRVDLHPFATGGPQPGVVTNVSQVIIQEKLDDVASKLAATAQQLSAIKQGSEKIQQHTEAIPTMLGQLGEVHQAAQQIGGISEQVQKVQQTSNTVKNLAEAVLQSTHSVNQSTSQAMTPVAAAQKHHHMYEGTDNSPYSCNIQIPGAWVKSLGASEPEKGSGNALFGTAAAQRAIWEHQNPPSCEGKKFLLHRPQLSGIGSTLHVAGQALAHALEQDRIMLYRYDEGWTFWTDDEWCGGREAKQNLDDCYFVPLSNCTFTEEEFAAANVTEFHGGPGIDYDAKFLEARANIFLVGGAWTIDPFHMVPTMFKALLEASPIRQNAWYYWWRAQSVSYIVRPNNRTLNRLAELRKEVVHNDFLSSKRAISIHIRHGDKASEAPHTPTEQYLPLALELQARPRLHLDKAVYVSTDDEDAIEWFRQNITKGWKWGYTESPRKPDPKKSTMDYADAFGRANEMMHSLLNLELALQCDAWIGTLSSNWCRLIDELRSTMRCKADEIFKDPAQLNPEEEWDFTWR